MSFKSGFVAIVGNPNVGKSSLFNSILDYNLSIVTNKSQTTRDNIKGILTSKYFQIIQNCLYKKEVKFINKEIEVNCDNFGDIKIYIYGLGEISIKLAISRKLERKDKTPAASK